jgi:hypothetical protein
LASSTATFGSIAQDVAGWNATVARILTGATGAAGDSSFTDANIARAAEGR